ncbi:MAG: NAD(P)-binding domain-containing protein, partial [Chloroflexales bacterium]|nr:NAD(P)-binding domain-containing protein [Chloroflexales bacterium]
MQISVLGLGYVGCVTAACMARDGHEIIGVDINPQKVELLNAGYSPIVEPGLDDLIEAAARSDRLQATTDTLFAVSNSEVVLICVGTPSNRNGSIKLDHIEYVCREVGA